MVLIDLVPNRRGKKSKKRLPLHFSPFVYIFQNWCDTVLGKGGGLNSNFQALYAESRKSTLEFITSFSIRERVTRNSSSNFYCKSEAIRSVCGGKLLIESQQRSKYFASRSTNSPLIRAQTRTIIRAGRFSPLKIVKIHVLMNVVIIYPLWPWLPPQLWKTCTPYILRDFSRHLTTLCEEQVRIIVHKIFYNKNFLQFFTKCDSRYATDQKKQDTKFSIFWKVYLTLGGHYFPHFQKSNGLRSDLVPGHEIVLPQNFQPL